MASMPMDQEEGRQRGGGKPPVSAHPAFPAIVALWFAALLGLGSLILPVQLIERVVSATGIASLVPAAAPPLGFTARAAIALAATIFGALLGVVAARRVAGAARKGRDEGYDEPVGGRRAFSAQEDLEEDGIEAEEFYPDADYAPDEDAGQRKRRRALAMEEEDGPSEFLAVAPLPGAADGDEGLDLMDDALELEEEVVEFTGEFDPDAEPAPSDAATEAETRQEFAPPASEEEPVDDARPFAFEDRSKGAEPLAFSPPSMARQAPVESGEPAEMQPAMPDEPQEDPVSEKQTFQPAVPQAFEAPEPVEDHAEEIVLPEPAQDFAPVAQADEAADSVGLVQLVQKLGSTLDKHREWSAQRAAEAAAKPSPVQAPEAGSAEAAPTIPQDFEAARPDDAAEAMAAYFSKPAEAAPAPAHAEPTGDMRQTFQPAAEPEAEHRQQFAPLAPEMRISDDEDSDDEGDEIADLAASFSLPLAREQSPTPVSVTPAPRPSFDIPRPSAAPAAETVDEEEGEEQAPLGDANYSSLSNINNPFKQAAQEFVRIDEPEHDAEAAQPAVVFPHQETRQAAPSQEAVEEAPAANVARPFDRPADAPATAPQESRQPASNDDNERALREALMNLQRMGK